MDVILPHLQQRIEDYRKKIPDAENYTKLALEHSNFVIYPGLWFSPDTLISSTNKTDPQDITEILLKTVLSIITLTPRHTLIDCNSFTKISLATIFLLNLVRNINWPV
jgi:hypothetical protein